jgi:hypothetical protein
MTPDQWIWLAIGLLTWMQVVTGLWIIRLSHRIKRVERLPKWKLPDQRRESFARELLGGWSVKEPPPVPRPDCTPGAQGRTLYGPGDKVRLLVNQLVGGTVKRQCQHRGEGFEPIYDVELPNGMGGVTIQCFRATEIELVKRAPDF